MHSFAGCFEARCHDGENIRRFYPGSLGDYFSGDSELVYDSPDSCATHIVPAGCRNDALKVAYGVATASEACSVASTTQVFLRCSPLIAPVTLST
jgi:hypothetical protein